MIQIDTRIKDPEQRIAEDIMHAVFGFWSTIVFNTALPACRLIFFSYRVGTIMGHQYSLYIAGGLGAVAWILRRFMPDYRKSRDYCWHLGCILPKSASNNRANRARGQRALPCKPGPAHPPDARGGGR